MHVFACGYTDYYIVLHQSDKTPERNISAKS